ncbi:MAG: type II toxin-antitoxin system RelE/ParE family toxin [Ignavibacteriales bacterium]|nr:type II toxin-antitoxin system RelE/ParE family toxin [Ignavibacteriales bacterium]
MIISFGDQATEDIFNGTRSKAARTIPAVIWNVAIRKLDMINAAHKLKDLRVPPANRLEPLKGKRQGFYSIRVNDQFRIIFRWIDNGAKDVSIIDYH